MTTDLVPRPDLSPFAVANARRTTWSERVALVHQRFPSTDMGTDAWVRAFDRDIEMMGAILRDVLKADQAEPGRPGPRRGLDAPRATPRLDEWMGKDPTDHPYTNLPFPSAFGILRRSQSLRHVERKTQISRAHLHRLLSGAHPPTLRQMEQIAEAYGKRPSWFLEYRVGAIMSAIAEGFADSPEHSVRIYESMVSLQAG